MIGTILGSHEIRDKVGEVGTATVYRAHQPNVDRDMAIKVIKGTTSRDNAAVQRFQCAARLISRLEHLHILPVHDFDRGHEPPYIVMRYLDGSTLRDVLERGRLSTGEVLHLIGHLAGHDLSDSPFVQACWAMRRSWPAVRGSCSCAGSRACAWSTRW